MVAFKPECAQPHLRTTGKSKYFYASESEDISRRVCSRKKLYSDLQKSDHETCHARVTNCKFQFDWMETH